MARGPQGDSSYVADTARVARELDVPDPPETEAELDAQIASYRPELEGSPDARAAARFLRQAGVRSRQQAGAA